jgi:hypothetical protein
LLARPVDVMGGETVENAEELFRHVDACPACRAVVRQIEETTTGASIGSPSATEAPGTTEAEGPGRLKSEVATVSRKSFNFVPTAEVGLIPATTTSREIRKTKTLTKNPMSDIDICRIMKRRLKTAKLPDQFSPHSFRVTTVTDLLDQNVALEDVQHLAGHADPRTTRLYDRRRRKVTRNIVERISIKGLGEEHGWLLPACP